MTKVVKEAIFFIIAAAIMLPTPTLTLMWMTGLTFEQVLYR
jgi:hypothetical protein